MEENRIGNRIRSFRKLKSIKQTEFAKQIGISVSVLGQMERGQRIPSDNQLKKMASWFEIDVAELRGTTKTIEKEDQS